MGVIEKFFHELIDSIVADHPYIKLSRKGYELTESSQSAFGVINRNHLGLGDYHVSMPFRPEMQTVEDNGNQLRSPCPADRISHSPDKTEVDVIIGGIIGNKAVDNVKMISQAKA